MLLAEGWTAQRVVLCSLPLTLSSYVLQVV